METGKAKRLKALFETYDASGDGLLSFDELRNVLKSLANFKDTEIRAVFSRIDTNQDEMISFEEFVNWIKVRPKEDMRAVSALAPASDDGLSAVFYNFCGQRNSDMDGKSFQKMCTDCGLVDKNLPAATVDLIFTKVAEKGRRRIDFLQFMKALELVAEKKSSGMEELRETLLALGVPVHRGTTTDRVSLALYDASAVATTVDRSPNRALSKAEPERNSRRPSLTVQKENLLGTVEGAFLFSVRTDAKWMARTLRRYAKIAISSIRSSAPRMWT